MNQLKHTLGPREDPESGHIPLVPDHRLFRLIASGAYGEVWLACNAVGTLRAVKVVRRDQHASAESFEREFKGLQKFEPVSRSHEGLVDILTLGLLPDGAGFYYVMELADNLAQPAGPDEPGARAAVLVPDTYRPRTLRAELNSRGALPAMEVIGIGIKLAATLSHLHGQGLVHRDVKPSNILFIGGEPKLADAGLVAAVDDARSLVGTAGYIAPEGPGSPQADCYALGKVIYEAAFGKDRQEFPALPPNIASRPDHQQLLELNEILTIACARDSRQRYPSAAKMSEELKLLQDGGSVKRKQARERRWKSAKKLIPAAAVCALAAGALFPSMHARKNSVPAEGPRSKKSFDANILCSDGFMIIRGDNYAAFGRAYTNFIRAKQLDPEFAQPYAGMLELQREWQPGIKMMDEPELRSAVRKLEQLGPDLGVTHLAQARLSYLTLDFPRARAAIKKAIEVGPDYEIAHTERGFLRMIWGWEPEARDEFRISQDLLSSKASIYCFLGHTYRAERDYTNAIFWYRKTLEYRPGHAWAYGALKETYEAMKRYEDSIENAYQEDLAHGEDETRARQFYGGLLRAYRERGERGYYEFLWKHAENDPNEECYWKACLQMHLGNTNGALKWLSQSVQTRLRDATAEGNLQWLLVHECWDPVRDDPRFKQVLDQTTFSKVRRSRN
jgi:serine/threonine protein kinase